MATVSLAPWERELGPSTSVLHNGDHLSAAEFLRRYEAMAEVKKAELVQNLVYMASPVSVHHAEPDSILQLMLASYAIATHGVRSATNQTVRLGPDDVIQPDGLLRIDPEYGGASHLDDKGYIFGAPELVAEIAVSSVSIDVREKRHSCRRAGVAEYLVWRSLDRAIDWWVLEDDEYRLLEPDASGAISSRIFPGLRLDIPALLAADGAAAMAVLQNAVAERRHAFVRR